jgi:hypothetical protein
VLFKRAANYDHVVLSTRVMNRETSQDRLHEPLKCHWSIADAKGHDCELPEPLTSRECRFLFVVWVHIYLQIPAFEIESGEPFSSNQLV